MYALPYSPASTRQEIMSTLGVRGIPSLIVIDSMTGNVITKSGRRAVEGNKEGCVGAMVAGEGGDYVD